MKTATTIAVTLLLTLVLFSPLVMANGNGNSRNDKWEEPPGSDRKIMGKNRNIMYQVMDDRITVMSMGKNNDKFDLFFFTLVLEKGVFMHYNYFSTSSDDEAGNFHQKIVGNRTFPENGQRAPPPPEPKPGEDEFRDLGFSILLKGLREFNETDHKISSYSFSDVGFKEPDITVVKKDSVVTGLNIRTFTNDGVFGLTFYLISLAKYGQDKGITPFEVKYDISIQNYPFQASDSSLALENIFALPEPFQDEPGERKFDEKPFPSDWTSPPKERTLGYDMESLSVFFSWATNVTVDGEDHNVTAEYTVSVDGESTRVEGMTFIYPQGQSILHDPSIGVADLLEIAKDATEFVELLISWSTGLGIGVVLIAAVAVRMKPSKFDWED